MTEDARAQRQASDAAQLISQLTLYADNGTHYHYILQSLPIISYYNSRKKCSFLRFFITLPSYPPIYL